MILRLRLISSALMRGTSNAAAKTRQWSRSRKLQRLFHVISQSSSLPCLMTQSQSNHFVADDDLQIEIDVRDKI
jgi:hypothetical protein